jgi:iron complex transport system substrate-binding protein
VGAVSAVLAAVWLAAGAVALPRPVEVVDATGARVVFPAPATRVVSLAPSVTEVLWAVGAAAQVVGVSSADDYPPEVRGRPRVGGVRVDEERLAALRPDLVVGLVSLQGPALARLRGRGYRVLALDANTLEQTYALVRVLGEVTGHLRSAQEVVDRMRREEAAVAARVRGRPRVRVFVQVWDQPFITAAGETLTDDLVRRAGGRNVFGERRGWPQVSEEEVLARDPECVVVLGRGADRLLRRAAWARTAAVRRGCVAELDASWLVRPGPRAVLGLRALARVLHPEVRL